jgi:hypothetical protein
MSEQEVRFLRERAQRLRALADAHRTALSDQLRVMADDLDARADGLEKRPPDPNDQQAP